MLRKLAGIVEGAGMTMVRVASPVEPLLLLDEEDDELVEDDEEELLELDCPPAPPPPLAVVVPAGVMPPPHAESQVARSAGNTTDSIAFMASPRSIHAPRNRSQDARAPGRDHRRPAHGRGAR